MDISLLIATYKRPTILHRTLDSLCALNTAGLSWELIVVDNAGDKETENVVEKFQGRLPLKFLVETKPGKNNALNRAIPETQGELCVFTDDDIIADPNWLKEMWKGAQHWPDHSVFGGKILPDWPSTTPWWGEDHYLNTSLFALHDPKEKEGPYDIDGLLPYGPNMAVRRGVFEKGYMYNPKVGPDGSCVVYTMGSETEFLERLRKDGYLPIYLPRAIVKHQIRIEQLSEIWLRRRNFRIGYHDGIKNKPIGRKFFYCSAYLWKQYIFLGAAYIITKTLNKKLMSFEYWCKWWRTAGKICGQADFAGKGNRFFFKKIVFTLL